MLIYILFHFVKPPSDTIPFFINNVSPSAIAIIPNTYLPPFLLYTSAQKHFMIKVFHRKQDFMQVSVECIGGRIKKNT